jgi:hypothetical protein
VLLSLPTAPELPLDENAQLRSSGVCLAFFALFADKLLLPVWHIWGFEAQSTMTAPEMEL